MIKLLKYFALLIVAFIICYFLMSFGIGEFVNPLTWVQENRTGWILLSLVAFVILIAVTSKYEGTA